MRKKNEGAKYVQFGWRTAKEDNCLLRGINVREGKELFRLAQQGNNQESQDGIKKWKMNSGYQGKHS